MFTELIESRPRPTRRPGSIAASLIVHGALAVLAVTFTANARNEGYQTVRLSDSTAVEGTIAELTLGLLRPPRSVARGDVPIAEPAVPAWISHSASWVTGRIVLDVLIDAAGRPDTSSVVVVSADDPRFVAAAKAQLPRQTVPITRGDGPVFPEVVRLRIDFVSR